MKQARTRQLGWIFVFILGCLGSRFSVYAQTDVRQGLVSYWPFETLNANTTPDLAVGNNLNAIGTPLVVTGAFVNAFQFTTSSNYFEIVHPADNTSNGLPVVRPGKKYTVMFWVKGGADVASAGDRSLLAEASTTNNSP